MFKKNVVSPFLELVTLSVILAFGFGLPGCQVVPDKTTGSALDSLESGFQNPSKIYHPETWFHINGNNISKEGLTKDLEAIKYAGLQGIQLFNKNGEVYPNVPQIKILSPEWEEMIGHAASECQRLGLKFTMQNCPGWSETGGPWVPKEEAQRELVQSVIRLEGGRNFNDVIPVNKEYLGKDYDYKDVSTIAFPTPKGDSSAPFVPVKIESNNKDIPWGTIFDPQKAVKFPTKGLGAFLGKIKDLIVNKVDGKDTYVDVHFEQPVTLRSLRLPPVRSMVVNNQYPFVDVKLIVQTIDGEKLQTVSELSIPNTNWSDSQYDLTLALPEITTKELRITFSGEQSFLLGYLYFQSKPRIHNFEAKAAFTLRSLQEGLTPEYDSDCTVDPGAVIDLTNKMDDSGKLNWEVPAGSWTVVRFGHVNMRVTNGPAVPEATGWECSKLDKIALENHLRKGMIGRMMGPGKPLGDGKLNGLLIDSWERMVPTWTIDKETIFNEFENRRGYDMHPFLPAMMGYIVKDQLTTEKFLRDLRETMDDLFVENFFAHFRTVAHEMGAIVYTEGAAGEVLPGDVLRYYGVADVPMTEFWFPRSPSSQTEDAKPVFGAASAAHLYNKQLVAAEACTEVGVTWKEHPFVTKYLIDKNFTLGINHLVFHTFSHTPQMEVYPGSSFGSFVGFPFVRNQTWWRHMPEFINYLSRCQFMLQQGEFVADVLWYIGDELEFPPLQTSLFPIGHKYDLLNPEILNTRLSVQNGKIKVKDGGNYRVIMLRNSERMLRSTAEKIKELVLDGAVILGDKPLDSPSLMDDSTDVAELKKIANELWGEGSSGIKKSGKGKVYWGKTLDEVLNDETIAKDVIVPDSLEIPWIHREVDGADIYFLSSQNKNVVDAAISFRVEGKTPEIWDALTGERKYVGVWQEKEGRTHVALSFDPNGSVILVFRKDKKSPSWIKVEKEGKTLLDCTPGWYRIHEGNEASTTCQVGPESLLASETGEYILTSAKGKTKIISVQVETQNLDHSWNLSFEEGWDAPGTLEMPKLASLTGNANPAVQYYSGTVTYRKDLQLSELGKKIQLDLGNVENIAELWCNDKKVGTRWSPPFVFDLTGFAQQGANQLEIKVTNTWRNQLIYDLQRSKDKRKTWTTNGPGNKDEKPSPAGLVGPVVVRSISMYN